MIRKAFISSGVAYHHGLIQPGEPLADFEIVSLGQLASVDLNDYDLVFVPRSADGEVLRARRYQFERFLDRGGVLIALGELWSNWFPGCRWQEECHEDILEPVINGAHPITAGYTAHDLHWHPSRDRWCCHGHLEAPGGAEVLVSNTRGDAWLYIDRASSNGVILATSNLDVDTHAFHGHKTAREFFGRILEWAEAEAGKAAAGRAGLPRKIAGLYSGVHFQRAFYEDEEFAPQFAILPVWELAATDLSRYDALWIPRESNQDELMNNRAKLIAYLEAGGAIVCWEETNQPWLPNNTWHQAHSDMKTVRLADHPLLAGLTVEQVNWHSHGVYSPYANAEVLVQDGEGNVMLYLDEKTFAGKLLVGTMDPDCHAGFGTETTRPLLRVILSWVRSGVGVEALALV